MSDSKRIVGVTLLAAAAAVLVAAAIELRGKKQEADLVVGDIEDRVAALDPVTRAAVVARLSADEAKHIHAMHE
jgi:hypothetical protein